MTIGYPRIEEAMSWQFAAHLASRLDGGFIVNGLFQDGFYNILEVRAPGALIGVNRPGSIHFHETPTGVHGQILSDRWHQQVLEEDGLRDLVRSVAETSGLRLLTAPRTDPIALQWRVTARLVTARLFGRLPWTCGMDFDRSQPGGRHLWLLRKGDDTIAELEEGVVRALSGRQVRLADEYRQGKTIDELVALVTRVTKP